MTAPYLRVFDNGSSTIHEYQITTARPGDVPALPAIELAAARLLAGQAPERVLSEATSETKLAAAQRHGLLWLALASDAPVGFAHVELLEPGAAHLMELDVHPDHGRRRLGTRLVRTVCAWASANGHHRVTLTTFRDVPWNMPFYARLGFEVVGERSLRRRMTAVLREEARRGLDPARRVVMERRLVEGTER